MFCFVFIDPQEDLRRRPGHHAVCDQCAERVGSVLDHSGGGSGVRGVLRAHGERSHRPLSSCQRSCSEGLVCRQQLLSVSLIILILLN